MPKDKSKGIDGKRHQRHFSKLKTTFGERLQNRPDRSVLEGNARDAGIGGYSLMTDTELTTLLQQYGYH
jgi:hypothetical protein